MLFRFWLGRMFTYRKLISLMVNGKKKHSLKHIKWFAFSFFFVLPYHLTFQVSHWFVYVAVNIPCVCVTLFENVSSREREWVKRENFLSHRLRAGTKLSSYRFDLYCIQQHFISILFRFGDEKNIKKPSQNQKWVWTHDKRGKNREKK